MNSIGTSGSECVSRLLQAEVRRHFDCPTLEGAELEDHDGFVYSLSHLEKRVFEVLFTDTYIPYLSRKFISVTGQKNLWPLNGGWLGDGYYCI